MECTRNTNIKNPASFRRIFYLKLEKASVIWTDAHSFLPTIFLQTSYFTYKTETTCLFYHIFIDLQLLFTEFFTSTALLSKKIKYSIINAVVNRFSLEEIQ